MASSASSSVSSDLVDVVNRFGFQLQSITVEADKSTGLCALNIYQCLMMAAAGSKGGNLSAFGKVMGFDEADLDRIMANTVLLDSYSKSNSAVELSSASSVWHEQGFILETPWKETMQRVFGATVGLLELVPINAFIEKQTKGKFKDLVKPEDLIGQVLMLITCLYFKAAWANPFNVSMTQESASFYTFDNKPQRCAMMHKVDHMDYREDEKMQVCILPYKSNSNSTSANIQSSTASTAGPNWKAVVILPKDRGVSALQNILSTLADSPSALGTLISGPTSSGRRRPSQKVALYLPRFKQRIHLDLVEPLAKLGLSPAFQLSLDFAPISDTGPLFVSRVTHDLVIEVNEEGTEVAAVTILSMGRSRSMEQITEMRVDRPFLFIVFDEVRKLVLCSIVVNSVEEEK